MRPLYSLPFHQRERKKLKPPIGGQKNSKNMRFLTIKQTSEIVAVSQPTLYRWAMTGYIPCHRFGRLIRFEEDEIKRWIEMRRMSHGNEIGETQDYVPMTHLIRIPRPHSLHNGFYHLNASLSSTGGGGNTYPPTHACTHPQGTGGMGRGQGAFDELDPLSTQPSNKRVNIEADPPGGARHGAHGCGPYIAYPSISVSGKN